MRHFVTLEDFNDREVEDILDLAREMKSHWHAPLLKGKKLGMIFFNPSFRTRTSFTLAMFELGGFAFDLVAERDIWKIEGRSGAVMDGESQEHINELVGVLSRYCDLIGVRSFGKGANWEEDKKDPILNAYKTRATVPFINLESALYHPCQAAADWMTIREKLGNTEKKKIVLSWCWHPKALPTAVPNSFSLAATRMGAEYVIACPEGYELDKDITARLQANAKRSGGSFRYEHDLNKAADGAHIVYCKSWSSITNYGNHEAEAARKSDLRKWIINDDVMAKTDNAKFMHCLPVRRNVVVTDSVIDSSNSIVIDQAENRLHVQKAILVKLYEHNNDI